MKFSKTNYLLLLLCIGCTKGKNVPSPNSNDTTRNYPRTKVIATVWKYSGIQQCMGKRNTVLMTFEAVYFDEYRESYLGQAVGPNQSYRYIHVPYYAAQVNNLDKSFSEIGTRIKCYYHQLNPYNTAFIWCTGGTYSNQVELSEVELLE